MQLNKFSKGASCIALSTDNINNLPKSGCVVDAVLTPVHQSKHQGALPSHMVLNTRTILTSVIFDNVKRLKGSPSLGIGPPRH